MTIRQVIFAIALMSVSGAFAQQSANRDNFLRQQAYAEMQRVASQIDTLQNNFDELNRRVGQLERGGNTKALEAEIAALKAEVASLKRELANQRSEIVKDLSGRIAKMQPKETPAPPPAPKPVVTEPTSTYEVQNGDSLYLIAKAFNTTVSKLRTMNKLKNDNLKIGQKLLVPQN